MRPSARIHAHRQRSLDKDRRDPVVDPARASAQNASSLKQEYGRTHAAAVWSEDARCLIGKHHRFSISGSYPEWRRPFFCCRALLV